MITKISEDVYMSSLLRSVYEDWLNFHAEYIDLSMDQCKQKFCDEVVDFMNGLYES